jgi:hypothetical protein
MGDVRHRTSTVRYSGVCGVLAMRQCVRLQFNEMVGDTRFERVTSSLSGTRSNQLS